MRSLGNCEAGTSRSIRQVFQLLLKDAFLTRFGFSGPRHITLIRDLAFLPHILQIAAPWRRIKLSQVQSSLRIDEQIWKGCLESPRSLDRGSQQTPVAKQTPVSRRLHLCEKQLQTFPLEGPIAGFKDSLFFIPQMSNWKWNPI